MSFVKADLECMAQELERIRDFVFNKKGTEVSVIPDQKLHKTRRHKGQKLLVVADEIYSDSNNDQSYLEEDYSGDCEDNEKRQGVGPSSLLED